MRRWIRWSIPILLAGGAVAGTATAWRLEAAVADPPPTAGPDSHPVTPILSARRVPSLVAAPLAERRLYADLGALVALLPPDSCVVVEGPDLRFAHRDDAPLLPASTAKLLTATAALEAFGSEARLRTALVTDAAPTAGVVAGDATLVGGGDALLATVDYAARFRRQPQTFTDLDALAAAVRESGVRRIEGAVVGDASRYDSARYVAGWPPRYIDQNVVGPLSALAVNDGFESYPAAPGDGALLGPAPDPAQNAAAVLTRLLEARGVDVVGSPRSGPAPTGATELAAVEAPPLVDVVGQMLRESDNSTAELLLKEIGRHGETGTTARGATAAAALLDDGSVDLTGVRIVDGSGLALDNRATCGALVDLLRRPSTGSLLQAGLPVAAESGTLAERFLGTPLAGVLRAKTGSLTSVSALAGVLGDGDPTLTFAVIVNAEPPARIPEGVGQLQQQIGERLAAWPRVPDLALLGPEIHDG